MSSVSFLLNLYCFVFIPGLMGVATDGGTPLIIAGVLWFMVPVVATVASIVSRVCETQPE